MKRVHNVGDCNAVLQCAPSECPRPRCQCSSRILRRLAKCVTTSWISCKMDAAFSRWHLENAARVLRKTFGNPAIPFDGGHATSIPTQSVFTRPHIHVFICCGIRAISTISRRSASIPTRKLYEVSALGGSGPIRVICPWFSVLTEWRTCVGRGQGAILRNLNAEVCTEW